MVFSDLLKLMKHKKASDLFVTAGVPPSIKVDGKIVPVTKQARTRIALTKRGLVLFVGGTGSGKSTSLAAMIGYRNEYSYGHILTIEDPIEFVHDHKNSIVNQREVGVDTAPYEGAPTH